MTNTAAASLDPQDPITSEVPEHLQELFQSTVQDNNLSSPLAAELKDLFVEHKETFATGPTYIGYCDLLQHDIDTGDHFLIQQSPCRPPLSARQAEDDILGEWSWNLQIVHGHRLSVSLKKRTEPSDFA